VERRASERGALRDPEQDQLSAKGRACTRDQVRERAERQVVERRSRRCAAACTVSAERAVDEQLGEAERKLDAHASRGARTPQLGPHRGAAAALGRPDRG
jgi:hypothetical protein